MLIFHTYIFCKNVLPQNWPSFYAYVWSQNKFPPNPDSAPAPAGFEFLNPPRSCSDRIWNSQIRYNPNYITTSIVWTDSIWSWGNSVPMIARQGSSIPEGVFSHCRISKSSWQASVCVFWRPGHIMLQTYNRGSHSKIFGWAKTLPPPRLPFRLLYISFPSSFPSPPFPLCRLRSRPVKYS